MHDFVSGRRRKKSLYSDIFCSRRKQKIPDVSTFAKTGTLVFWLIDLCFRSTVLEYQQLAFGESASNKEGKQKKPYSPRRPFHSDYPFFSFLSVNPSLSSRILRHLILLPPPPRSGKGEGEGNKKGGFLSRRAPPTCLEAERSSLVYTRDRGEDCSFSSASK